MKKNALRDRLMKNSTLSDVSVLSDSLLFADREIVTTDVPFVNVALSGRLDGGLNPGVLMLAGPSKHFKTAFGLLMVKSFLNKHKDGIILFYDSQFGTNDAYFETFGINKDHLVHCPITNIEQLKFDIVKQLGSLTKEDHVLIFIDSIGQLASLKEATDAENAKSVADMTRAKEIKSLFRIITPHLTMKNIPLVVVNHTYKTLEMYAKDVVSGGTGSYYSANDIWIIGRQQDKEDKDVIGYNFVIKIEKSRTVKEGSKIPINVSFETGIYKYSGMFEVAEEGGWIQNPTKGFYTINGEEGKKLRRSEIEGSNEYWETLLKNTDFQDYVEKKYRMGLPENITEVPVNA